MKAYPKTCPWRASAVAALALAVSAEASTPGNPPGPDWDACLAAALQFVAPSYGLRQFYESQVYRDKGKGKDKDKVTSFQLLVPTRKAHHYRIASFATLDEALAAAQAYHPLNLRVSISDARRAMFDEVMPVLRGIEGGREERAFGVRLTQRTKNLSDLRRKIFGRVAKTKSGPDGFDISQIDDLAGSRMLVPDPAGVEPLVQRIIQGFGAPRVTQERIDKASGYRATHLTVQTIAGPRVEIQVMTERMERWSNWDHDRVYKPEHDPESAYYDQLRRYGAELARYLRAKDDGTPPPPPDPRRYGIRAEDEFNEADLR